MMTDLGAKYDGLCERLDKMTASLERLAVQNDQLHSMAYREWEPLQTWDGAAAVSNTATIAIQTCQDGWEAYIDRISVTAAGASATATVAAYRGAVDPTNLIDYANALFGNTPSRIVGDYNSPIYFRDGGHIRVVVAGLAGATEFVTVRIEGRRRTV